MSRSQQFADDITTLQRETREHHNHDVALQVNFTGYTESVAEQA